MSRLYIQRSAFMSDYGLSSIMATTPGGGFAFFAQSKDVPDIISKEEVGKLQDRTIFASLSIRYEK